MNTKIAIITLGGDSYYRQSLALKLFFAKKASKIFIIGEDSFYFENNNTEMVNKIELFKGAKVFNVEYKNSKSTLLDAKNIIKIIKKYEFDKYLIITSDYHLKRVVYTVNKLLPKDYLSKIEFKTTKNGLNFSKKILEHIKFFYYKILLLRYEV